MMRKSGLGMIFLCFAVLVPAALWAQGQGTGSIEGVVTDSSGGVLPGVEVTIRNVGTNAARVVVTNDRGHFLADLLLSGEYEISASHSGFSPTRVRMNLVVGSIVLANLKLQVAGTSAVVEVSGEAEILESSRVDVANTIGEHEVENLPINGRRWENFVMLTPGVSADGAFGLISYRGISGLYNNNSIDGADNNQAFFSEARGRTRISYTISQASVKEFQVGLSNFSAEFGRAAGGMVNAVTKSGTNRFHGEGFYYLRDKAFLANDARARSLGQAKPDELRQQFGASAGGPVVKDKLFFFGNYDQQKRNFPGFVFPTTDFGAVSCTAPGCAATLSFLNTLTGPFPRRGDNYVFLTKLDWIINQKHTLGGSYNFHKWNSPNGIQTQTIVTVSPSANGQDGVRTDMLNMRLTSVLNARNVNEFRFQYGRDFEFQVPNAPGPGVSFTNGVSYGMPNFLPRAAYPNEKRFQFADNYSFIRGKHSIRTGLDINYVREQQINLFNGGGVYSYSSLNALAQDCPVQATGCTPQATGTTTGKHYNTFQQAFDLTGQNGATFFPTTDWNFYVQDSYRFRPSVTFYLGLRYEYSQLPQPTNGNPLFPLTMSIHKDKNNWGPRAAFSWDIGGSHKTVLRSGYGLYYGRTSNSAIANALLNNGRVIAGYSFTPTSTGAPVFAGVLTSAPSGASAGSATYNFFSSDYVRPMIHSVDFVLEREISKGLTVSGSYIFSRGQHLPLFRDINLPAATGKVTYLLPDGSTGGTSALYLGARPNSSAGQLIVSESVINSNYNGFVLVVSKRLSRGVQFSSNFTVSKALDNGQTSTTFFGSNAPFNSLDRAADKGLSDFDVRKRSVSQFVAEPSISRFTNNTAARALFNDWQFSGIVTLSDGKPLTGFITGGLPASFSPTSTSTTNGSQGSNRVPFIGRNAYTSTGQTTFDLRMTRNLRIKERMKVQVIWEAFNLFNTVNYTSFQTTQYRIASSSITGTNATLQLADFTTTPFLLPINTSSYFLGARQFQFGLKFLW